MAQPSVLSLCKITQFLASSLDHKILAMFPANLVFTTTLLGNRDLGQVQVQPFTWLGGFLVLRLLLHILMLGF